MIDPRVSVQEIGPPHDVSAADTLERLGSTVEGLNEADAARRLREFGPNLLSRGSQKGAWSILVDQFRSVVVLLLLAAAGLAWVIGDELEAVAVLAVLAVNTGLGILTEMRARSAIAGLLKFDVPDATVIRGGKPSTIPGEQIVPGDVIVLEEGMAVPADARLLESNELQTSEAPLTGESAPVAKDHGAPVPTKSALPLRRTVVFKGTSVVRGTGTAVVYATGDRSELGRIGRLLERVEEGPTPMEVQLDRLGGRLIWMTLGVAALITALAYFRGSRWSYALETGIALAIAAVPEGLPAVATIAMAVGVARMARRKALVRRLPAVETLGSTTVVCTDKTGTLTTGRMAVDRVVTFDATLDMKVLSANGDARLLPAEPLRLRIALQVLEAGSIASTARVSRREDAQWEVAGDPMEGAIQIAAAQAGLGLRSDLVAGAPELGRIPFSSERRWMATLNGSGTRAWARVKGTPSVVIEACDKAASEGGDVELTTTARDRLLEQNSRMGAAGLRVLAVARGREGEELGERLSDLTFLGLIGLMDPPAEGVAEALDAFRGAGIRTMMITGDQPETAAAIAEQLGMTVEPDELLGGQELADLGAEALRERVGTLRVLSQVSPEDKLRVVEALRDRGEVVAMFGDGVNDAAALRRAHVGVAMGGRGTDVAKEAAAVVLQDDQFPTIVAAVEGGRVIYDNVRRFVFYLFSCNLAEVLVLFVAGVLGLPQPLRPLQILWLNLVTDTFPALALALEPPEDDVMKRAPRDPRVPLLDRKTLLAVVGYAVAMAATTLIAFQLGRGEGSLDRGITMAFVTLALVQLFHLGNARNRGPVLHPAKVVANRWALGAVFLVVALQIATIHWAPLAGLLGLIPLSVSDWAMVGGLSATPAVLAQAAKWLRGREGARS